MTPQRRGRPSGPPKMKVTFSIRPAVYRRFRRFVGTAQVVSEVVERAMIREMSLAQGESHGTV